MLERYNITLPYLAARIHRSVDDLIGWFDGSGTPPAYLELTLRAVRAGRKPVSIKRMNDPNVGMLLGVPAPQVAYWHKTQQYPIAARLAVATVDYEVNTLTQHELKVLGNIIKAGKYYRHTGGFHTRPILGKRLPKINKSTVSNLKRLGYVKVSDDGVLTSTRKGENRWFIR